MPSYLIALAVGALESRVIGPRSKVWSEAEMVEKGAYEFAETEKFISTAESIVGPYVWGSYDILLLPPSFPYGGMENPCLTFVTPTLLAGDRSLADVVAHEIAHSWFGNLVTSNTWEHFWMNEGFTVFLERKIVKAMKNKQQQHLSAQIGWKALEDSVNRFGHSHPYTCLNVKLTGVDPDDAFSSVPYEKGFNFLFYLEELVGGEDIMNPFLRAHCDRYKYSTVNTQEWKRFFLEYFKNKGIQNKLDSIDWDLWLNKPGLPPKPQFDLTLSEKAHQLAEEIVNNKNYIPKSQDLKEWESPQIVVFLEKIQELQAKQQNKSDFIPILEKLDSAYKFSSSQNSEIRFRWLTCCIRSEYTVAYDSVVPFLSEQGRMKFIRPLYRDLYNSGEIGKGLSRATFEKYSKQYHSIAQKMVAKDLELTK